MTPKEKAYFLLSFLNKETAIEQCYDEMYNSNTPEESDYWEQVKEEIEAL